MTLVFDGHNDTLTHLYITRDANPQVFFDESDAGQIDLPRARQGGLAASQLAEIDGLARGLLGL